MEVFNSLSLLLNGNLTYIKTIDRKSGLYK